MSAAAEAADAVAAAATANQDRDRGFPPTGGSGGGERAGVAAAVEGSGSRPGEEDGDVEMPDVKDLTGPAPRSRPGEPPAVDTAPVAANGGEAGAGEDGRVAAAGAPGSRAAGGCASGSSSAGGLELATAARAAVLSVAGLQARGLAEQEERRTEALLADLLEARVQRLEAKLHCFDELDQVLETERACLEHDRAELVFEQARSMLPK
ncbi:Phasmid Socket Absent family member (psa-1) [Ectocarpus siliculosus]|uniref:Phasmid Socket Absent family member (Psa-1) n=1 Tax=Ectocarpus siliculosus TaxID=2880 RepID=D8LMT7_ECTSI|nr:Phasmid Socket Absent family member (psa-1) [Ectocarpus siliculosus]|eukprot:CBN74738.1 Phasmid Socket Absent family member (psa-1) [Ectocarpus siliculosus]